MDLTTDQKQRILDAKVEAAIIEAEISDIEEKFEEERRIWEADWQSRKNAAIDATNQKLAAAQEVPKTVYAEAKAAEKAGSTKV